jgi:hypothetical protein
MYNFYIRKRGNSWQVVSKGGKVLGTYPTREKAVKRLRQVEYWKKKNKGNAAENSDDAFYLSENIEIE